jgi:Crp-like helix-turn-helix domain
MTHEEMAMRIEASRETVTRLLSTLRRKRLFRLSSRTAQPWRHWLCKPFPNTGERLSLTATLRLFLVEVLSGKLCTPEP